jgi:outer membrane receptor for ferrienterochelin and colicins
MTGRVAYDYYGYQGLYPYDYGEAAPVMWVDRSRSDTASGEMTLRRRFAKAHLVTVGTEVRQQLHSRITAEDNTGLLVDIHRHGTILGAYVQDEIRVTRWLLLNAGARLDRYPTFGTRATPRIGAVVLPRPQTAIKVLYGIAFRAPNPYEAYYYNSMSDRTLDPEVVQNTEVVWEEYISSSRMLDGLTAPASKGKWKSGWRAG